MQQIQINKDHVDKVTRVLDINYVRSYLGVMVLHLAHGSTSGSCLFGSILNGANGISGHRI